MPKLKDPSQMTEAEIMAELAQPIDVGGQKHPDEMSEDEIKAELAALEPPQKMGVGEAGLIGLQKGATAGGAPLIAGLGEGAGQAAGLLTSDVDMPISDRLSEAFNGGVEGFKSGRQSQIDLQKKAMADRPEVAMPAELAGGLLVPGGAAKSIGGAALHGAGLGALNAAGEAGSLEEAGKGIAASAAGGAVGQALASGVSALASKVAPKLNSIADRFAFSSLRGSKKDISKAFEKGEIEQIGKELYDQGIVKNVPKSVDSLAKETGEKIKEIGKTYGAVLDDISKKAGPAIDPTEVAINAMNKIDQHVAGMPELASQESTRTNLYKNLDNFVKGGKNLTINEAQTVKQSLNQASKWNTSFMNGVPDDVKLARTLYHEMNNAIDNTAEKFASKAGKASEVVQGLRKQLYNLNVANKMAEGRSLGDVSNRFISPTDYISGSAGMMAMGPKGLILGAANKAAREYGSGAAGIIAKKAANVVGGVAKGNVNVVPQAATIGRGLLGQ